MIDFDPSSLEVIGKNRLLRLLYVLVGLNAGITARDVGRRVGMDGAEVSRAMKSLQDALHLSSPPAVSNGNRWTLSPRAAGWPSRLRGC